MTTETLLARGWADTEDADPSYVWVTMRRLRTKLEPDPNRPAHLLTVRGIGYRLVARRSGASRHSRWPGEADRLTAMVDDPPEPATPHADAAGRPATG